MTGLVLSLTSIPPRFAWLGRALAALRAQRAPVVAITLWLPRHYRRFGPAPETLPLLPEGVEVRRTDRDWGPATKLLPALEAYAGRDVAILFCDDDKLYDPGWAGRFLAAAAAHPGKAIVEEGGDLEHYGAAPVHGRPQPRARRRPKDVTYRLGRLASLGLWKPRKTVASGHVDILEGWGGVLVRPGFFDRAVFDLPETLWTVDDVWFSGHLARRGVPIWLEVSPERPRSNGRSGRVADLRRLVHADHDRAAANRACIEWFRSRHGIWR